MINMFDDNVKGKLFLEIDRDLKDIIICALRYVLRRHSYILEEVGSYIKNHKGVLDDRVISIMLRDINETLECYEDSFMPEYWKIDIEFIEDLRRFLEDYDTTETD